MPLKIKEQVLAQNIIDDYYSGQKKTEELAQENGVNKCVIRKILNGTTYKQCIRPEHHLEIMERTNQYGLGKAINYIEPTEEQKQIIIGSLLGDAWIGKSGAFHKEQCLEHKDYIYWHMEALQPFSSQIALRERKTKIVGKDADGKVINEKVEKFLQNYHFSTYSHPYFKYLRKWMYPDGIKIVPSDIDLKPLTLAVWFCDDGTNNFDNRYVYLCTNGFSIKSVNILREKLFSMFKIESNCHLDNGQPKIYIGSINYDILMYLVKPYIIWDCFVDKIAWKPSTHNKLSRDDAINIFKLKKEGLIMAEISRQLGIERKTISNLLSGKSYQKYQMLNF